MNIIFVIFWVGLALLIYTYFGFPLFLIILSKLTSSKSSINITKIANWPKLNLVIAAYNEEKVISEKIRNCLSLDYPPELIDVWIASDGSSDQTNEITRNYTKIDNRIHLLEFTRSGKSSVLNKAMTFIKEGIVVFSDANTEFASDALKKLVMHFLDPKVGCTSGRLIYRNPGGLISGKGESFYWRYETALKRMESKLGFVAGANGAIYAIRRELFDTLPPRTINDDFLISMRIVKKGFKSIYEEDALAYEDVAPTAKNEFQRHVRDSAGHYIAIAQLLGLLNPFLGIRSFIYWSHRILRWAAPFILITLFFINMALLNSIIYRNIFILQVGLYALAATASVFVKSKNLPFFLYVPYYFCNLNLALMIGFFKTILGKQKVTWERTERA